MNEIKKKKNRKIFYGKLFFTFAKYYIIINDSMWKFWLNKYGVEY